MRLHGRMWIAGIVLAALTLTALPTGAQGQGMIKVTFAQAQDILSFAPAYIARARFFKQLGINAQFEILSGGGPVFAAVSGGSAQFGLTASVDLVNRAAKGEDFVAILGLNFQTIEGVVNSDWARRKGVNKASTLKAKIEALRGSITASTSPGAISDTMAQYMMRLGGMEPGKDAQIVPIGGIGPRLAALSTNRVQFMWSSPPAGQQAEKEGYGFVLFAAKDLPGFNRQVHEVLIVRKSWLTQNPDVARRVATAIAMGNNFLRLHFEESVRMHEPFFANLGRDVLEPGVRSVRAQTIRDGVMKATDWVKTMELLRKINAVEGNPDTTEGLFWTNAYIDLAKAQSVK